MILEFDKLLKIAYPDLPSIFTEAQLKQINDIIMYHDYYDGETLPYIIKKNPEYGRSVRHGRSYSPTAISINYIRKVIDKLTSFQFEIPIDISVASSNEKLAEDVETYLYEWHKRNKLDLKHLQASKEHNITGGVAYKLLPDDERSEARIFIRERIECYPVTEYDDYEKLNKVHFMAFKDEDTIWKQSFEMVNGICYIEEAYYDVKDLTLPATLVIEYQPLMVNKKPIDFLPVYIIPNLPMLGEVWGLSEIKDLTTIQEEINRKYSDLADSLRFEMFAITILLNIASFGDNTEPETKPGAVWSLFGGSAEKQPKVEKLESHFQYIESLKYHLESMKSLIFELSDCIQLEGKQIESVGTLSGVALRMLFANMISKINQKNTIWSAILEQIYTDAAKIKSMYDGSFKLPDDMDVTIIPHVPVPLNQKEEIEIIVQKLSWNLMSVRAAMDQLGVQNPEMMIKEILDEKKTFEEAFSLYADVEAQKKPASDGDE